MASLCLVQQFRDSMVNNYKNIAIGWANDYSPVLDVTSKIALFYSNVKQAKLTIYGDDITKIRVIGGYNYTPLFYPDGRCADPSICGDEAVRNSIENWQKGEEWERQYCSLDGLTYWVVYPCKLEIIPEGGELIIPEGGELGASAMLLLGLGALLVLSEREKARGGR